VFPCSCSCLTLGDAVQQHGDLLIVEEPLLQKLDKHTVGEAAGAQLEGLGILAPEQPPPQKRNHTTFEILLKTKSAIHLVCNDNM